MEICQYYSNKDVKDLTSAMNERDSLMIQK